MNRCDTISHNRETCIATQNPYTMEVPIQMYHIEQVHSFGSGQIPPPVYFSRRVKTVEQVKNIVLSGILNDCQYFRDGYTSDDECVDKDAVYTRAINLSDMIVTDLNYKQVAEVEFNTSPHNSYLWRVKKIEGHEVEDEISDNEVEDQTDVIDLTKDD